jgi:hypothetical protein
MVTAHTCNHSLSLSVVVMHRFWLVPAATAAAIGSEAGDQAHAAEQAAPQRWT